MDESVIEEAVKKSNWMQLGWCERPGIVRHTAVVVVLDDMPLFTIDFGLDDDSDTRQPSVLSVIFGQPGASAICVNRWDGRSIIKDLVVRERVSSNAGCERAMRVIKTILRIRMNDYDLGGNNCRDFVKKALSVVKREYMEGNVVAVDSNSAIVDKHAYDNYANGLQETRAVDSKLLAGGAVLAGAAAAACLFGAIKLASVASKTLQNHKYDSDSD